MAYPRTSRRPALSSKTSFNSKAGKTYPKSSLRTTKHTTIETSSDDDSNDDEEEEGDESNEEDVEEEDEIEDESDDEPVDPALSRAFPFDFDNDRRLTGTDEEMDIDITHPPSTIGREFEKSMELADVHAAETSAPGSDNDDYDGVDAISDEDDLLEDQPDDESEVDVLREAEKDLIAEFEQTEQKRNTASVIAESLASADMDQLDKSRRFSLSGSEIDDPFGIPGVNMNEDPFQGAAFMDETWGCLWENAELGIWRKPGADNEMPDTIRNSKQKRVRFQESTAALARASSNSSSESSEEDEEAEDFPDIFMDQADPKIQHLLAHDSETEWNGLSTNGSDAESVYDFEDDADRFAFELDEDSGSSEADVSSESGDDGDETEDETVEEQQAKMQQFRKAMRLVAAATSAPNTPRAEKLTTPTSNNTSNRKGKLTAGSKRIVTPTGKGPRQGTFTCDPTKATLTTDRSTRKTILYPPSQPTPQHKAFWDRAKSAVKTTNGSPRPVIAIPARDNSPERPFTARATLASMFDGRLDVFDDAASPAQAVQPFPRFAPSLMASFTAASTADDDASDMDAEYPAEFSNILNMEQFQDDSSDTDMGTEGGIIHDEPAFLSQGVVGSFRLNQHRAKMESSLASHPAKRNATAEHNALQSGRRGAGNAPITPARKRRTHSQDLQRTGSGVKKNNVPAFSSPIMARRRHSRGQSLSGRLDQTLTPEMWKKM